MFCGATRGGITMNNQLTILDSEDELTELTRLAARGDRVARDRLIHQLYPKLRAIARSRLAAHSPPTLLDTTGLLHESLAKMLDRGFGQIENSRHLVAYAATVMRTVLVDYARERNAQKRDGGDRVTLTGIDIGSKDRNFDLVALDQALSRLSAIDERLTTIVELRCFGGFGIDEVAAELDISERTVKRDWQKARAFLLMFLDPPSP
jgi:RNA polymerase sigma factor (TIGR02999 family)